MFLSTQTLPYHTVAIDCSTLRGREDTPDGFMGAQSVAGVWRIKEQRWIPELSHPCIMNYDWSCYPPLIHGATIEPIFAATDENGLACEIPDDALARYHAGAAADRPIPAGMDACGGRNRNVRFPPNLPSPFDGVGYWRGFGAPRPLDLATRIYNGTWCATQEQRDKLDAFTQAMENRFQVLVNAVREHKDYQDWSPTVPLTRVPDRSSASVLEHRGIENPRTQAVDEALSAVGDAEIAFGPTLDALSAAQANSQAPQPGPLSVGPMLVRAAPVAEVHVGMTLANLVAGLEETGRANLKGCESVISRTMAACKASRRRWRNGPRTNHMCTVCKELRYHVNLCPTCFVGICWSLPEFAFAIRNFAAFVHAVQSRGRSWGGRGRALHPD